MLNMMAKKQKKDTLIGVHFRKIHICRHQKIANKAWMRLKLKVGDQIVTSRKTGKEVKY